MLAEMLDIGRATAYHRFDRLVDNGVIEGFSATSTRLPSGGRSRRSCWSTSDKDCGVICAIELSALPGVQWLGVATGRFDFVLLVRADSLEHLPTSRSTNSNRSRVFAPPRPSCSSTRSIRATTRSGLSAESRQSSGV